MSDWKTEWRRQRGEHIDDTIEPRRKAQGVLGGLKSVFIGDTPAEMAFNAATLGAVPLKALRPALMGLSALSASDEAQASPLDRIARILLKTAGPAKSSRVFKPEDIELLRDQLALYTKPRALPPEHAASLRDLLINADQPGIDTHVLYTGSDFTEPSAAFQLTAEHDLGDIGNYMPNLVSLLGLKGQGTQALQEARRAGPYGLVSTPGSKGFYSKLAQEKRLPGFQDHADPDLEGIAYQYKKDGGLVTANFDDLDEFLGIK